MDTTQANFLQEATVPIDSETHAAEDVAIYARGPGAHAFQGVVEQNVIFHVMAQSERRVGAFLCFLFGNCRGKSATKVSAPLMTDDLRAGMAKPAAR